MVMAKGKANNAMYKSAAVKSAKQKKEHTRIAGIRMLIMVLADVVGISILSAIRGEAKTELQFVTHWLLPLTILFGVLSAASLVYLVLANVKKLDISRHPVTPAMLLCVSLFCLAACLLYKSVLPSAIIIASVTATVLFLVYYLYMQIFYR